MSVIRDLVTPAKLSTGNNFGVTGAPSAEVQLVATSAARYLSLIGHRISTAARKEPSIATTAGGGDPSP